MKTWKKGKKVHEVNVWDKWEQFFIVLLKFSIQTLFHLACQQL